MERMYQVHVLRHLLIEHFIPVVKAIVKIQHLVYGFRLFIIVNRKATCTIVVQRHELVVRAIENIPDFLCPHGLHRMYRRVFVTEETFAGGFNVALCSTVNAILKFLDHRYSPKKRSYSLKSLSNPPGLHTSPARIMSNGVRLTNLSMLHLLRCVARTRYLMLS